MILIDVVSRFKPWSAPGRAWAAQEDWLLHGLRLWADEPGWMVELTGLMIGADGWLFGPVIVDDGFVQDAHHRIVVALMLGWHGRDVPVVEALARGIGK